jgi:hypothetical protein
MIISDANEIVRARQAAIRRELDRRGIALKAVGFDSGIPYATLLTYFPQEGGARPVMLPAAAIYALTNGKAIPLDLLSLLVPAGYAVIALPDGLDLDELDAACRAVVAEKAKAHRSDSPGGPVVVECERRAILMAAAPLRAVG